MNTIAGLAAAAIAATTLGAPRAATNAAPTNAAARQTAASAPRSTAGGSTVRELAAAPVGRKHAAAAPARMQPAATPSLIVLIVVDQLRADLLDRYDTVFTGGFRRLRDTGWRFRHAMVDHAITVSHPGHTTIATGLFPSHHGIVDGAWTERRGGQWRLIEPLVDSTTSIVGFPGSVGASPRQILATELPDWFRAADPNSRTVAIGVGRHVSVLHGGKGPGDVYWFDAGAGEFVTSTYYRHDYPPWPVQAHMSPYTYDRSVPLIFMGTNIPAGASEAAARTVDVAPTLAWLAGVPAPPGLDGHVLRIGRQ